MTVHNHGIDPTCPEVYTPFGLKGACMSGEVERITDPATIRNIDWSDHYETTTPRGATPMFDAAQDLSEREADANALEAYRALVASLESELADVVRARNYAMGQRDEERAAKKGNIEALNAALIRTDEAEARVDQLTDLLTLRTEALNRTGESNDKMRATIARVEKLATAWECAAESLGERAGDVAARGRSAGAFLHAATRVRAALADQEPS